MKRIRIAAAVICAALLPHASEAFPCRTGFGAIEVPALEGFTPGDSVVKKGISRTMKAIGGQSGKVACVLVHESEIGSEEGFSELISISQTSIEAAVSDADFRVIVETTRAQIDALSTQVIRGFRFGGFQVGDGYYCNTLETGVSEAGDGATYALMGGVLLGGRLFSFVAHSATAHDAAARDAWKARSLGWIGRLRAANARGFIVADPVRPPISTTPNIDGYTLAGVSLERLERARTRDAGVASAIDAKFEHPKSMVATNAAPGALMAFARVVDGYEFRVEICETPLGADLDAALDGFARLGKDDAENAAATLAPRLVAQAYGAGREVFRTGATAVDGRNALWADTWQPAPAGWAGSAPAVRTIWVQADGLRAFALRFSLRDTLTPIVPAADLSHLNLAMLKVKDSVRFQNKKQFKKR